MSAEFPVPGVELSLLLVVETPPLDRGGEIRCFFRDPDGHLLEISEVNVTEAE